MRSPSLHRSVLVSLFLAAFATTASARELLADFVKDVAAPPSDIVDRRVVLPAPEELAVASRTQARALETRWSELNGWIVESDIAVDADGPLALAILTPGPVEWIWTLTDPSGTAVDLASGVSRERRDGLVEVGGASGDRVELIAARAGRWTIRAVASERARSNPPGETWLLARSAGAARLVAHASTVETRTDVELALVARFEDAGRVQGVHGTAVIQRASGALVLELQDDGAHQDGLAGDGTFGATLPRGTSGDVRARIELNGTSADGAPIARTVQIAFPVIERQLLLTGVADATLVGDGRVRIRIEAVPLGSDTKILAAAEVWGTNADGRLVPVCWLARMQEPRGSAGLIDCDLALDVRWIEMANARAPFVLRRVRVQDPDTQVPHDLASEIAFAMPSIPASVEPVPLLPTTSMLQGTTSAIPAGSQTLGTRTLLTPTLALVHGYCSGGSIWPAAHFSQPKIEFLDPNANRTHDQFALLLRQAMSARSSFGVVAHSQGGQAALHLYTFYASGLDTALGPRLIQSVGTPYQGTPLASLGGFSCGVNNDMTTTGGPVWLSTIPTWAREKVFYWTTQNSGSACNFLASLVLGDPEDGTTEMVLGQLPGANSMGHVNGWCHTTGMSNPAQYTDATRNAERNAQAAR